ncbi:MAG: hypothetical protein ACLGJB_14835 [Blastocatellia bacterium]
MTPYPLHRSETSTKILITFFMLFMVGSFTVALLNVYDKVGRVPNGVVERYGPDVADAPAESAPAVTGAGGIYDEAAAGEGATEAAAEPPAMVARMNTYSALLDVTHPHIFEMPIIILVLCHFVMRTRLANWAKVLTYALSFGGVAGMLATPWLVRYVSVRFAPMMMAAAAALAISAVPLIFVPLWDMWMPARARRAAGRPRPKVSERYAAD